MTFSGDTARRPAVVGVSDHGGWALLVTALSDGTVLDTRRVELLEDGLPALPHHHEAQRLAVGEGVALVERERASAERHAAFALAEVAAAVPAIAGIALRRLQALPPTVAERIANYRARNVADWVMYREALALAAESRGWYVRWYDPKTVVAEAAGALRRPHGSPWNQDVRLAMAAAIVAARR